MANQTHGLLDIFHEILAASAYNSSSPDSLNETQILKALREQAGKDGGDDELESLLVKVMQDARSKLNLTLKPESCDFCEGSFRDVVQAYNGVHGYVSLLVSY